MKLVGGKIVAGPDDEATPVPDSPSDAPQVNDEGYPVCANCGELNYEYVPGTRGRKPKYHEACKPVTPNRSTSPTRTGRLRNESALRDGLIERYMEMGMLLNMVHPAYGVEMQRRAEMAADADIAYAKVNPRFRRVLENALEKTALGAVLAIHAKMFAPVFMGVKAQRSRAAAGVRPAPAASRPPDPIGEAIHNAQQNPARPQAPASVTEMFPAETDAPGDPEVVNAAAMPGMPGV